MATGLDRDGICDGKSRPSPELARIPAQVLILFNEGFGRVIASALRSPGAR